LVLDIDDVAALLSEVASFARERIVCVTERPETPISHNTLIDLSTEAAELGLIPSEAEPEFGIWAHCDQAAAMAFNVGFLQHIGYANTGIAFAWHRASLARKIACELGMNVSNQDVLDTSLVTTGHYGLAQAQLGKFLSANSEEADTSIITDWLDREHHQTTMVAPASWETLLWPVWRNDAISWEMVSRKEALTTLCRAQHGFDELNSFLVCHHQKNKPIFHVTPKDSRAFYERALKLDMIGLLSIGAGAINRAWDYAYEYANIRKQGGKMIAHHAAVQHMLGDIRMTRHHAENALHQLTCPVNDLSLSKVAALRAAMHPMFCHAANQAMQVHGGIGYMRDAGLEKIVRDQNMLKLLAGGLREIPLLLAELNEG